ncbi:MAG TPA: rhodanese-like domain-containing protein [Thermodesulfobacteriota bacterium]|nr:rhodanese-like domain-containing protein [Thermodesulfobacteriota bacterium]
MLNKTIRSLILGVLIIGILQIYNSVSAESNPPNINSETQVIKDITPDEAFLLIEKNKDNSNLVILDVRTSKEFEDGHIKNAINLDFYSETFKDDLDKLDKNKIYVTHCQLGGRSAKTVVMMKDLGFVEVYNITGGIAEWKSKGLPTIKSP